MSEPIQTIRRFNRTVTRRIGALEESYLSRGRPLGQARLIFEVGPGGADLGALRLRLGLDSGYLSRLLRSLEADGLVSLRSGEADGRAKVVSLTPAGQAEWAAYDRLSDELANSLISGLSQEESERLVAAMAEVDRLMRRSAIQLDVEAPETPDSRRCIASYFAELNERFDGGFDPGKGRPHDEATLRPPAGWLVIARIDGQPVGCGAVTRLGEDVVEIKRMWTAPDARGQGVARRILVRLEEIATSIGARIVRLDTNSTLSEAQAFYRSAGYREIARYNDNPYAHLWFEKRLDASSQ